MCYTKRNSLAEEGGMMIRIALCDDEQKVLNEVSSYINQYAEKQAVEGVEIGCFSSARSLKNVLDDGMIYDIFVLDVYIGDELGLTLAQDIRKRGIENPIIFLTASIEHAPQSFETGTLRYLLKPIDIRKLYEALDVAIVQFEKLQAKQIMFKTESGVESVNAARILCSEAHGHYQHLLLEDRSQIKIRMTVTELYTILAKCGGFARVGSAYIINLRNIKNISANEVYLYHDVSIPIPRGKYAGIRKAFWDFQYKG